MPTFRSVCLFSASACCVKHTTKDEVRNINQYTITEESNTNVSKLGPLSTMRDQFYITLIKTRTSHIVHKLNNNKKKKKGSYLSDKNNLRNQEDGEARRRLAEKVSVATEKHNSNKSLAEPVSK